MTSVCSNDDVLASPTSEFDSPWSHSRTTSNASSTRSDAALETRHPRFRGVQDLSGRRGSAAGQHDLVIQAQKGLGPTLSQGQDYQPKSKALNQYDLQTQAQYGLGPTVSRAEPVTERRGSTVEYNLLTQAVYGLGPTVPVKQEVQERKARAMYNLSTQASLIHGENFNLRDPFAGHKTQETFDLSSQYRKFH